MPAWEWLTGDAGGLNTILLGIKRHTDLKENILNILLQFGRFNFPELFTLHLKRALPEPRDLLYTINQLFKPLSENKASK